MKNLKKHGKMQKLYKLDTRGLLCPLPIIRLKKLVESLEENYIVRLVSDDPVSDIDVPAWCINNNQELISTKKRGKDFIFSIKIRIL
tara:strand:- start:3922 stop:4182 length:261 start_codon:yes stop_codon:yes gene_type:complete